MINGALDINNPVHMGVRDLSGRTLPEPDVYDIDGENNPKSTVDYLHARGKKVVCYIDAGVYETYRSDAYKFQQLTPQIWGKEDAGWDNSYWLDIRRVAELEPIMKARTPPTPTLFPMIAMPTAPSTSAAMPTCRTLSKLSPANTLPVAAAAWPRISVPSAPGTVLRPPALASAAAALSMAARSPLSNAALRLFAVAAKSFRSLASASSDAFHPGAEDAICESAVQRNVGRSAPRSNHFQLNAARMTARTKNPI